MLKKAVASDYYVSEERNSARPCVDLCSYD
jgi:hypothetical protein